MIEMDREKEMTFELKAKSLSTAGAKSITKINNFKNDPFNFSLLK